MYLVELLNRDKKQENLVNGEERIKKFEMEEYGSYNRMIL